MKKVILALALAVVTAHAAPPSEQSVRNLVALQQYNGLAEDISNMAAMQMAEVVAGQSLILAGYSEKNLPSDATAQKVQQALPDLAKKYAKILYTPALQKSVDNALVAVYQKHFDQAEIDAQIAFLKSPAGKRVMQKQGVLNDELANIHTLVGKELLAPLDEKTLETDAQNLQKMLGK